MTKKVAIIGGGAAATLLLAHLSRLDTKDISVDVYDRTERFARGVAYSTRHDTHLLNVRAANMSALQEDKDHFARWVSSAYTPLDFVPRKLYGEYLSGLLEEARQRLDVKVFACDVVTSVRNPDGLYTLSLATGDAPRYNDVVLASGNVRALGPKVQGDISGYYGDPWTADFECLKNATRVALIGSGLTAVDMVLALEEQGYSGEIIIFSRNALLPASHVDPVSADTFLSADDEKRTPLELLSLIRRKIRDTSAPWQSVIDSLRPHTNTIWKNWSDRDRVVFQKKLMTFWNIHRHRMAPQIYALVKRLQAEGRLRLVKAGVRTIESGPLIRTTKGDYPVDAAINCLGYRYDEAGRTYEVSDRLGPARFGELFETTAIPEIRAQAYALAQKIVQ